MTSSDGVNWIQRQGGSYELLEAITYGNGQFVAVGVSFDGPETNAILTSADGVTWTSVSSTDDTNTTAASATVLPSTNRLLTPAGPVGILAISYWRVNISVATGGVPITIRAQVGRV